MGFGWMLEALTKSFIGQSDYGHILGFWDFGFRGVFQVYKQCV